MMNRIRLDVLLYAARVCAATLACAICMLAQSSGSTVTFASDNTWLVYASDPATAGATSLGFAEKVCLNLSRPQSCPSGAISYGNPAGGGWSAELSSIPGASWIWAPNITGNTPNADLQYYYFTKTLLLPGVPVSGWISVAVDDYAKIYINGQLAGEYGSVTSFSQALAAQSALKKFDITALLRTGSNTITVFAQNGPKTFNGCNQCRYSQNSAGVVFGGVLTAAVTPPDLLGFAEQWRVRDEGNDLSEKPGAGPGKKASHIALGQARWVNAREDRPQSPGSVAPKAILRGLGHWGGFDNAEAWPGLLSSSSPRTFVNSANGNQVLRYDDLTMPGGGLRFNFIRVYNTMDSYSGPLGLGWTHAYNLFIRLEDSGLATLKEADGREVSFAPSASGAYTAVTKGVFDRLQQNADGSYTLTRKNHNALSFSASGRLMRIADQNGRVLICSYDPVGNLTKITDPEGRVFSLAYNQGLLISLTDPSGRQLKYGYDANGRLVSFLDPVNGQTLYVYEPNGQLIAAKQPGGTVTSFQNAYDNQGRVMSQSNPTNGTTVVSSYSVAWSDPPGSTATTLVDALGRQTIHIYDSRSRLIRVIDALGGVTSNGYDDNNNLITVTDPLGNTTQFWYDVRGNLTQVKDAADEISTFTYDANDNLVSAVNGRGTTVTYVYDSRNNLIQQSDGLGNTTKFEYDDLGRLVKTVDANGHVTTYGYDSADNVTAVTDALGHVTTYAYDARGNRTAVVNTRGNRTLYGYDLMDRLTRVTDPLGNVTTYGYDALGNIIFMVDANGRRNDYAYSGLNRVTGITYSDRTKVTFSYDAVGNRTAMADSRGPTLYTYDALNRPVAVAQPDGQTVRYSYDAAGNRTSLQYPDSRVVKFTYDRANRMTAVIDWRGKTAVYAYDAVGNVTSMQYPNGTSSSFTFDGADRLVRISNSFQGSDQDSIPLTTFDYNLDPVGNRTEVTDGSGHSVLYSYDPLDQLVGVSSGTDNSTYQYDAGGNRISAQSKSGTVSYSYDAADRLLKAGSTSYKYDKNGNRVWKSASGGAVNYSYDPANRLVSVSAGRTTYTFEYDGDGNRVGHGPQLAANHYQYINDTVGPLAVVLQEKGPDGTIDYLRGHSLLGAISSSFEFYYLFDALRSAVGLTDPAGLRIQRYMYDDWGTTLSKTPSPGVGTSNKFAFTGEALDPGTGLYFLRARYYDPETGRFLSKDPYPGSPVIPLSLNPYIYVRNNPLRYIDASGLDPEPPDPTPPPPPGTGWPYTTVPWP